MKYPASISLSNQDKDPAGAAVHGFQFDSGRIAFYFSLTRNAKMIHDKNVNLNAGNRIRQAIQIIESDIAKLKAQRTLGISRATIDVVQD